MKLRAKTVSDLAEMITGGSGSISLSGLSRSPPDPFPYRTGWGLTTFFQNLELEYKHTGSRVPWTKEVLAELNEGPASQPELPADNMVAVIRDLMDAAEFERCGKDRKAALDRLNKSLVRDGLEAFFDQTGLCQIRSGSTISVGSARDGAWSQEEIRQRAAWEGYLATASEDEFTEKVLVPLLRLSGFLSIQAVDHKDKALEYGKDLRMKFRLPTGHFIYFAIQVKKGKLDAAGKTRGTSENVTEVLNQVRMALDNEIFDPEVSRRCLVDHVYVVATGDITKQAKNFLAEKLDREKRRQLIFMDRDELLDLLARRALPIPSASVDEIPF
jgi:hypothetical protein